MSIVGRLIAIGLLLAAPVFSTHANERDNTQAAYQPTLLMGLYPFLSPDMMNFRMQPLADFLRRSEVRNVKLKHANSYQQFLDNSLAGSYDIIVAPAHFAALLSRKQHYQPLLLLDFSYVALTVSLRDGPVDQVSRLKGKTLAIPDWLALVSLVGLETLQLQGVPFDKVTLIKKATHDRSLHALFTGETDAAIISSTFFNKLPSKITDKIHIINQSDPLIGDIIMARSGAEFSEAIVNDFADSIEGEAFYQRWKIDFTLKPINAKTLEEGAPFFDLP